ncbi:MAG: 3-methyladenine DNA glycosylase AlkD [Oceanospirillaceae bacterium]|jgi:3-methyladenine DNA glycosylase AlkD
MKLEEVIKKLEGLADSEKVKLKRDKFGIHATNSLGIYHKDLKLIAKELGHNNELAIQLFETGIYEARILCSKMFKPADVTDDLMERWVSTFENWEICDSFCMGLFAKSTFARNKILEWTLRNREFEKRAGFVIIAAYCMADKYADNETFEQFFPLIISGASDDRLYVKKAVNWALRNIGKRNPDLKMKAITVAKKLSIHERKPAKWIGCNAMSELGKPTVNVLDYPRSIYRNNSK